MPLRKAVQGLSGQELLGDLPLECGAVGTMPCHDFHPPEARTGGQTNSLILSTARGALQNLESFGRCFTVEERRRDPLLIVCEEAHRYVPDRGEAEYAAAQSAIRRVAREGRKYGLGLMLVSQRPADIESTVFAQCGTWLILRLSNSPDQQHVSRFLPDGLAGMTRALASLGQQEALFVGEGASLPARVRIRNLTEDQLPRSENPKFAQGWSGVQLSRAEVEAIADRMSGHAPD